jgi:DNA-binding transcriptional MerR regulator
MTDHSDEPAPDRPSADSSPMFEVPEEPMSSGEFGRRTRLSMKALRLYDRLGLLPPAVVDAQTGYRTYHASQLFTARLIVTLRRLDMPLPDVARVLHATGADAAELVEVYWASVERRVAVQRDIVANLRSGLAEARRFQKLDIAERRTPGQIVLTEQRHVYLDDLPWIRVAAARLLRTAERHGGVAGAHMAIFHGEVSADSDGPVEVCVPIQAPPVAGDVAWRTEPARREAYVTITKAQFEMPVIRSVYDAIDQWIAVRGLRRCGSPREIYHSGVDAMPAALDDPVADVAIPF